MLRSRPSCSRRGRSSSARRRASSAAARSRRCSTAPRSTCTGRCSTATRTRSGSRSSTSGPSRARRCSRSGRSSPPRSRGPVASPCCASASAARATDIARIGDRVRFLALLLARADARRGGGRAGAVARPAPHRVAARGRRSRPRVVVVLIGYFLGASLVLARFDDPEDRRGSGRRVRRVPGRPAQPRLRRRRRRGDHRGRRGVAHRPGHVRGARGAGVADRHDRAAATRLRALRAVALIAAGVLVVAEPSTALTGRSRCWRGSCSSSRAPRRCCASSTGRPPPIRSARTRSPSGRTACGPSRWARRRSCVIAGAVTVFIAAGGVEQPRAVDPRLQRQRVALRQARSTRSCSRRRTTRCPCR